MKSKQGIGMGVIFVLLTFGIMMLSTFVISFIASILLRHGVFSFRGPNPFIPMFGFLFMSVLLGTVISVIISKMILKPILKISDATKQIAKGDFNLVLNKQHWIKEIREISENFNLMAKELQSIETLRSDFVVSVSHEFKTPIASMEGYATLLQDDTLTKEDRIAYTNIIIDSTRQLSSLTGNILRLSKLENQKIVTDKELYRLDEQIRQAILLLEPQWLEKNINLDIQLERHDFYGNSGLMHQVWLNIIGNAIKFTPKNGEVSVTLVRGGDALVVEVSDSGIGMTSEVRHHIFDKFYQGDAARSESGNGLGLALAKRIVDLCGGQIAVESSPGEGSTFIVVLPAVTAAI